jgi:hypothetical protein
MSLTQNEMGRAFEYGIAISFMELLTSPLIDSTHVQIAKQCFHTCPVDEQSNILTASKKAATFLVEHDSRLSDNNFNISIQSDQTGKLGDVRDVIIHNTALNADIGISAKNRHGAIKHSRLSPHINFGKDWFGIGCSKSYFDQINPIFEDLKVKKQNGEKWKDIPDKKQVYYLPLLEAFGTEMAELYQKNQNDVAKGLVKYLLGKYDFYKIIKEDGTVSIYSFNIDGSLKWGNKLSLPNNVVSISQKPNSETTLIMTFDHGWQISFRIHNASTLVEPSLKFDVNIVGLPINISKNEITYL